MSYVKRSRGYSLKVPSRYVKTLFPAGKSIRRCKRKQTSTVVAYVPSWLKSSYLSEILEASVADITHHFEEGSLADFEVDGLVNLYSQIRYLGRRPLQSARHDVKLGSGYTFELLFTIFVPLDNIIISEFSHFFAGATTHSKADRYHWVTNGSSTYR